MILNSCKQKVELEYPCSWTYKLIGFDQELIRRAVQEIVQDRDCDISFSRSSRTGKYHCLNLQITVYSEEDRSQNHLALKKHPAITMVL